MTGHKSVCLWLHKNLTYNSTETSVQFLNGTAGFVCVRACERPLALDMILIPIYCDFIL